MHRPVIKYFETEDILHIAFQAGEEHSCRDIDSNTTLELDENGIVIGVEIKSAGFYLKNLLLTKAGLDFTEAVADF